MTGLVCLQLVCSALHSVHVSLQLCYSKVCSHSTLLVLSTSPGFGLSFINAPAAVCCRALVRLLHSLRRLPPHAWRHISCTPWSTFLSHTAILSLALMSEALGRRLLMFLCAVCLDAVQTHRASCQPHAGAGGVGQSLHATCWGGRCCVFLCTSTAGWCSWPLCVC